MKKKLIVFLAFLITIVLLTGATQSSNISSNKTDLSSCMKNTAQNINEVDEGADLEITSQPQRVGDTIQFEYHVKSSTFYFENLNLTVIIARSKYTQATLELIESKEGKPQAESGAGMTVLELTASDFHYSSFKYGDTSLPKCTKLKFKIERKRTYIFVDAPDDPEEPVKGFLDGYGRTDEGSENGWGKYPKKTADLDRYTIKTWLEEDDVTDPDLTNNEGIKNPKSTEPKDETKKFIWDVGIFNTIEYPLYMKSSYTSDVPPGQDWDPYLCSDAWAGFTLDPDEEVYFKFEYTCPNNIQEGDVATFIVQTDAVDPPVELADTCTTFVCAYDTTPPVINEHGIFYYMDDNQYNTMYKNKIDASGIISVAVKVSDETIGVDYVNFSYSIDNDLWETEQMIYWNGTEKDANMVFWILDFPQDAIKIDYMFTTGDKFDNNITSETYTYYIPKIEITEIIGGFGVSADIKNTGVVDEDVNWSIDLSDFLLFGEHSEGTISIPAGETKTINTGLFLGFGPTTITVIADSVRIKASGKASGFMLGPFAIGIT